jgi:flagellin
MSISLSQGMRTAVYSMGDIQSQVDMSNKRLATGKKVNDALDNAKSYFQSQGYRKDGRDLGGLMDSMDTSLKTVQKAVNSLDSMRKLVESAQALARSAQALGAGDANRDVYGAQAAELLNQAAKIANDSGFGGFSLLQTNATPASGLTTVTNLGTGAAQTNIAITGTDMRFGVATGIGTAALATGTQGMVVTGGTAGVQETIAYTGTAADKWTDATNGVARMNSFVTFTTNALSKIQATASSAATQATTIQIRQDFTKNWIRTNNEAADYLTLADMNEEGANLSALQTKQQLAVQALSLASRADQAILRLF